VCWLAAAAGVLIIRAVENATVKTAGRAADKACAIAEACVNRVGPHETRLKKFGICEVSECARAAPGLHEVFVSRLKVFVNCS